DLGTKVRINGHLIGGAGTTTGPTDYEFNDEDDLTVNTTYYYWLESLNYDGESEYFGPISLFVPEPGNDPDAPDTVIYDLRNSPNPFYPETTISFSLSEPARIKVTVYNIKGQEVIRLFNGFCSEDNFSVSWNGKDSSGSDVTSGIYYYKLQTQGYSKINKMILMK
ncbi:MAG: T9SS type A sorting domain-containing protein, partial [Candidatus Cloacimonetes bacterium]|nr:T9SS type A sorting domain-containing protein [Candidatus Cloacimonadota bacterium]